MTVSPGRRRLSTIFSIEPRRACSCQFREVRRASRINLSRSFSRLSTRPRSTAEAAPANRKADVGRSSSHCRRRPSALTPCWRDRAEHVEEPVQSAGEIRPFSAENPRCAVSSGAGRSFPCEAGPRRRRRCSCDGWVSCLPGTAVLHRRQQELQQRYVRINSSQKTPG